MKYVLYIAGCHILCDVPYELYISDCTVPFIRDSYDQVPDAWLRIQGVEEITKPVNGGVWQREMHFFQTESEVWIYHHHLGNPQPYAKVYFSRREPNKFYCDYRIGQELRISCTKNLIDLLGLENVLLINHGFLLHASFIDWHGKGILFTAPPGTGKSTQAALWEQYEGAQTINGDRAALVKRNGCWYAYGLPIAGTSGIYRNESAPISAVVILSQAKHNLVRKLRFSEIMRHMYPEITVHRWDANFVNNALNLAIDFIQSVPVYMLECLPDKDAVDALKQVLSEEVL